MIGNSQGKVYHPAEIEAQWYAAWREKELFKAENSSQKPTFSVLMPPPLSSLSVSQVNGSIPIELALALTIPDIIARRKKMQGFNILYFPGLGQAGNVAQVPGCMEVLSRLGLAMDWSRLQFPAGEVLQKLTDLVFVQLYREGKIYRGDYQRRTETTASKQWFLKTAEITGPAIDAVETEKIMFFPAKWKKEYFRWLDQVQDWCISRQLQEGCRIPVYYCDVCGSLLTAEVKPSECRQCESTHITQDPNTLDPTFTSALWPFAALGWQQQAQDFKDFFPMSLMPANTRMIFSRLARTIMMAIYLGNHIPFREVFINSMIRDSKDRDEDNTGNSSNQYDTLDIIDHYGADALRFTLAAQAVPGRDIVFSRNRLIGFKLFINKIWNASRRVQMSLMGDEDASIDFTKISDVDRWLLNGLNNTIVKVNDLLDSYQIHKAANLLYHFSRWEFCHWYLEMTKHDLDNPDTRKTLKLTFYLLLQMLHPFIPFITEELRRQINPGQERFLIQGEYPTFSSDLVFPGEFADVETLKKVIKATRKTRTENGIAPKSRITVFLKSESGKERKALGKNLRYFEALAGSTGTQIVTDFSTVTKGFKGACANWEILLPLDSEEQRLDILARLEKDAESLEHRVNEFEKRLSDENFTLHADEPGLSGFKKSLKQLLNRRERIRKSINDLL